MNKKIGAFFLFSLLITTSVNAQNSINPWSKKVPNFKFKQTYIQQNQSNTLYIGEEQNNNNFLHIEILNKLHFNDLNQIERVISEPNIVFEYNGINSSPDNSKFKELTLLIDNNQKIIESKGDSLLLNYLNQIQFFDLTSLSPILKLKSQKYIGDQWLDSNFTPNLGVANLKLLNISENKAKIEVEVELNMLQEVQAGELIQFNYIGSLKGFIIVNTDFANLISQSDFKIQLEGRTIYSETKIEIPSTIKGSFSNALEIL